MIEVRRGIQMGTFTETAIVDYRLSFADQGKSYFRFPVSVCSKQTEFCCFRFPFAESKRKFAVSDLLQQTNGS
jgi:hypothetical protein